LEAGMMVQYWNESLGFICEKCHYLRWSRQVDLSEFSIRDQRLETTKRIMESETTFVDISREWWQQSMITETGPAERDLRIKNFQLVSFSSQNATKNSNPKQDFHECSILLRPKRENGAVFRFDQTFHSALRRVIAQSAHQDTY
jgi:hypothetical protein